MSNTVMLGWNRPLPGREKMSSEHFQEFIGYLQAQKEGKKIDSYEPVLLEPYGGSLNGFFLIRGSAEQVTQLTNSPEWIQHQVRVTLHVDGACVLRGVGGSAVGERMAMWRQAIPA
jgi:hypothetical protein